MSQAAVEEKDEDLKPVPAMPAATILLIRDGLKGLEVLMMRRAMTMKFAPGAYVFPGGKVDEGDGRQQFWRRYIHPTAQFDDLKYRIGALRELYEESGVLFADHPAPRQIGPRNSLTQALDYAGCQLNVQDMQLFSHWITPVQAFRRFDTKFYLAPYISDFEGAEDGSEMIEKIWVNPTKVLKGWEEGKVPLMFPTRLALSRLAEARTVADAVTQATKRDPIPILPLYSVDKATGKMAVTIPAEAGFGITKATDKDIAAEAKIMRRTVK